MKGLTPIVQQPPCMGGADEFWVAIAAHRILLIGPALGRFWNRCFLACAAHASECMEWLQGTDSMHSLRLTCMHVGHVTIHLFSTEPDAIRTLNNLRTM